MTLSRSPSPVPGGGWSSPGLNINSGRSSPALLSGAWESSRPRNHVNGYPSFSTQHQGFFQRHMRRISSSLPRFTTQADAPYAEKEKLGRGRWPGQNVPLVGRIGALFSRIGRKMGLRILWGILMTVLVIIFFNSRKFHSRQSRLCADGLVALFYAWRNASWGGGGSKFVIILGSNVGGGVMEWKGAREWAIERDSIRNKKKYTERWGYELDIVDMTTKKRYAHEWRESWEKVDYVRAAMRKYPDAEW